LHPASAPQKIGQSFPVPRGKRKRPEPPPAEGGKIGGDDEDGWEDAALALGPQALDIGDEDGLVENGDEGLVFGKTHWVRNAPKPSQKALL